MVQSDIHSGKISSSAGDQNGLVGMSSGPFAALDELNERPTIDPKILLVFGSSQGERWLHSALSPREAAMIQHIVRRALYFRYGIVTPLDDSVTAMAASAGRDGRARLQWIEGARALAGMRDQHGGEERQHNRGGILSRLIGRGG